MKLDNSGEDAPKRIQLVLDSNSITAHAYMMQGVLITQKFEGFDCYLKLVDFLRQLSLDRGTSIEAEIIVN